MDANISLTRDADRVRILVVDDDPAMLDVTALLLDRQGYSVTQAICSMEAITKIKERPNAFDVVVTDYSMPIINGVELAIMIRELEVNIPVILATGKIDYKEDKRIAAVVSKPYSTKDLDEVLKKVLKKIEE